MLNISSTAGKEAAESVRKDLEGAHRALASADVQQMLSNVEARRDAKGTITELALTFSSDEAYHKMFIASADIYVLERKADGSILYEDEITPGKFDENGKRIPKYRKLTPEEKQNLQPGANGKINVFNNGIFNSVDAVAQYADQHNPDAQYFIYFPETSNAFAELLVAGWKTISPA